LSLLLKFFHQLAKSFFSFPDSLLPVIGVGLGPLEPTAAVEGPPVAIVGCDAVASAVPDHNMRVMDVSYRVSVYQDATRCPGIVAVAVAVAVVAGVTIGSLVKLVGSSVGAGARFVEACTGACAGLWHDAIDATS
jgi:hypothetical protein